MSIVAIISSPEKNGNTETVVRAIAKSAEENGQTVQIFNLNPMANKKGCQSCYICKNKGFCTQKDDLTPVLDAIRAADGVIISSPVYFGEACGQYRILEDRFFSFIDGMFRPNIAAGKKVAVVTAAGSAGADTLANRMEGVLVNFFKFIPVGKISMNTNNDREYAKKNAAIMEEAAAIGKKF